MAPAHSHGTEAEAFYVLDGRMDVHVADQSRGVAPGDFVYIPRRTRHAFEITSSSAKFLCLVVPGGFEDYFLELGELTNRRFPREPTDFGLANAELSCGPRWPPDTAGLARRTTDTPPVQPRR